MKPFNRRQLLLGGVAAGAAATLCTEPIRRSRAVARQAAIDTYVEAFYDPNDLIQAAVTGDIRMVEEF